MGGDITTGSLLHGLERDGSLAVDPDRYPLAVRVFGEEFDDVAVAAVGRLRSGT